MTKSPVAQQVLHADTREFRVFISSTFLDMKPEREYLINQIFPELQQICRERGVLFTPVDLRWGITDRQARMRKIVSNCLENIHRHNPYVIALIGERYGWQPRHDDLGKNPAEVLEEYPWLEVAVQAGCSLVELETIESASHNPALRDRMRFYFRSNGDPSVDGSSRDTNDKASLHALKDRIRSSGLPVREPYGDIETLGKWVREDLLAEIERLYPSSQSLSFIERERRGHEAFAASRRRVYVEHPATLRRLDEFVVGVGGQRSGIGKSIAEASSAPQSLIPDPSSLPVVITGNSGSGKSSLLSFWSDRYRLEHPEAFIITHHVGATATSTSHLGLLRRIMLEIQDRYNVTAEVPTAPEKIESEFRYWLGYASKDGLVLVIDALNQLSESSRRSLKWLPDYFPPYIRMLVSTLDGEILDELKRRNWQIVNVKPLTKQERTTIVKSYLRSFGKQLDAMNVRRLVSDPKSISPLFLVTTLDELRVSGSHEDLSRRVGHYLEAEDLDDLYQRVLERMENDYGKKLVRDVMSLIWASRNGLSESELLALMQCSPVNLTRLLHGLGDNLLAREGLLGFFHEYLRQGVEQRYLRTTVQKKRAHVRLADHFEGKETGRRALRELAWQLQAAGQEQRLAEVLSKIEHFMVLYEGETKYEVLAYWKKLGDVGYNVEERYRNSLDERRGSCSTAGNRVKELESVALLLEIMSCWNLAEELYRELLKFSYDQREQSWRMKAYNGVGTILWLRGEYAASKEQLEQSLAISEELGDRRGMATAFGSIGVINKLQGNYVESLACLRRQLTISEELGDRRGMATAFGNIGVVYMAQGRCAEALECARRQLAISEELGDYRRMAIAIGNMGNVYMEQGCYAEALEWSDRCLTICEELGDRLGSAFAIANMGLVHRQQGRYAEAMACHRRQLAISEELGHRRGMATAFGCMGNVHMKLGAYAEALECSGHYLAICEEMGDRQGMSVAIGIMGDVHVNQGHYVKALECFSHFAAMNEELGDRRAMSFAIGNMGFIYSEQGRYANALQCYRKAIVELRAIGFLFGIPNLLEGMSRMLVKLAACLQNANPDGVEIPKYLTEYVSGVSMNSPLQPRQSGWILVLQKAREDAEECIAISEQLQKRDGLFGGRILLSRIEMAEGNADDAVQRLDRMLEEADSDEERAELHYWLWKTSPPSPFSASGEGPGGRSKIEALRLYEQLFSRTPKHEYKKRIEELKDAVAEIDA